MLGATLQMVGGCDVFEFFQGRCLRNQVAVV